MPFRLLSATRQFQPLQRNKVLFPFCGMLHQIQKIDLRCNYICSVQKRKCVFCCLASWYWQKQHERKIAPPKDPKYPYVNFPAMYPNIAFVRYAKFWVYNTRIMDPNITNPQAWHINTSDIFQCWEENGRRCGSFCSLRKVSYSNKFKVKKVLEQKAPVTFSMKAKDGFSQTIPVTKGKEVIITFYVLGDASYVAKWMGAEKWKNTDLYDP